MILVLKKIQRKNVKESIYTARGFLIINTRPLVTIVTLYKLDYQKYGGQAMWSRSNS